MQNYPVESFAINFDKWKLEMAKDKNAIDCYTYFSLHFDKNIVYAIEQKKDINNMYIYKAMHGKVNDPVQRKDKLIQREIWEDRHHLRSKYPKTLEDKVLLSQMNVMEAQKPLLEESMEALKQIND
ncbi:hypothetical protein C1645_816948 [Glomus cerebriforme]|uniref:Uncharacterized protein n=1 Tax=Glomus cerebriforme TaxID=658196 RepID=A0A397TCZ5_9GLOM|nr:hypothetical protein C1645_816948 [Glomus cerebriforme]